MASTVEAPSNGGGHNDIIAFIMPPQDGVIIYGSLDPKREKDNFFDVDPQQQPQPQPQQQSQQIAAAAGDVQPETLLGRMWKLIAPMLALK